MGSYKLTYQPFGSSAILVSWPNKISKDILMDIRQFVKKIEISNTKQIVELNFVYNSLLVSYKNNTITFFEICKWLKGIYKKLDYSEELPQFIWEIPVCYHPDLGIDLNQLASEKKLAVKEVCQKHNAITYTVFGIGFLPGFLYLGGLPKELHFPRRKTPRPNVPRGAVAIGGNQTGIYPQQSPGGWHIIGRTPISVFDPKRNPPIEITPGDGIRFRAISKTRFSEIEKEQAEGKFQLKKSKQ